MPENAGAFIFGKNDSDVNIFTCKKQYIKTACYIEAWGYILRKDTAVGDIAVSSDPNCYNIG